MSSSLEFLASGSSDVRSSKASPPEEERAHEASGGGAAEAASAPGAGDPDPPTLERLKGALGPLRKPVRSLVGFLWHLPDRLLHRRRRRRAVRMLQEMPSPDSVLFICVGNICRSPYAERALRRALPPEARERITLRSAGLEGWDHPSPSEARVEAERRGVDLTDHRSRALTYDLVDSTDLFLVTAAHQARTLERSHGISPERIVHLGDLDPEPVRTRTIVDPWGKDAECFRQSYDRIDRCLEHLVQLLR